MAIETTPFQIDAFRQALGAGGARSNQFLVQLTFPNGFIPQGVQAAAAAPFLVSAASLPGSTMNQTLLYYRGREVKLSGERTFAPWSITVLNDTGFTLRNALEAWQNGMNNFQDNTGVTNPFEYYADFTVTQLDRNSNPLKAYSIRGAFPVDISAVALDHGANDQISSFQATFAFQDFTTSFDGSPDDGATNSPQFSRAVVV